jgi:hypothetical protein
MAQIDEEKIISNATKDIAKQLGWSNEVHEFHKRLKRFRDYSENRASKAAAKEFAIVQKKFPKLMKVSGSISYVYRLGMVDGFQIKKTTKGPILMYGLSKGAPKWARLNNVRPRPRASME